MYIDIRYIMSMDIPVSQYSLHSKNVQNLFQNWSFLANSSSGNIIAVKL